jgi:hypothetical protein
LDVLEPALPVAFRGGIAAVHVVAEIQGNNGGRDEQRRGSLCWLKGFVFTIRFKSLCC